MFYAINLCLEKNVACFWEYFFKTFFTYVCLILKENQSMYNCQNEKSIIHL